MENIDTVKLENGLTLYFYEDKRRHSTFFQFVTLFGAKTKDFIIDGQEYHIPDGVAHILEHYIVEENSRGNFLKLLGEKQMNTNACTHYEMTRYYFEAVEELESAIKILLESIYSPIFEQERLERIKLPIYQEIKGRSDNKFYHSNIEMLNNLFHNIKFRNILGSIEKVKCTKLETLKLCYEAFYQPSNQFIVIGGNFNKKEVLRIIRDFYQNITFPKHDVKCIKIEEENTVVKKKGEIYFPTGEEYREVTYKINIENFTIKERLKLDFYLHYFYDMFFGITSPLYKNLVTSKVITDSISCSDNQLGNFLLLSVGSYSNQADILEKEIKKTIKNLDSFNQEIFELDKKNSILKIILREERLIDTIMPLVDNIVRFHYPHPDTKEDIESFNYDDFVKIIKSLDFNNYTVTSIKNIEKK